MHVIGTKTNTAEIRSGVCLLCLLATSLTLLTSPVSISAQTAPGGPQTSASEEDDTAITTGGHLRAPATPFAIRDRALLNRGVWQGYTNYGRDPYETFSVSTKAFEVYDRLGERQLRGYPLISWQESRSQVEGVRQSSIYRSESYWQWFDNLLVYKESQGGWNVGIAVGDKIRTTLTPLTLQRPRWDGARLDANTEKQGFTILVTRGQSPRFSHFSTAQETSPIIQYGSRWYRNFGSVLTTGITLFNQHMDDVLSERGGLLTGTLGEGVAMPTTIWVRITDDSPDDATGARVEGVHIVLRVLNEDGSQETLTSDPQAGSGRTYDPRLRPMASGGRWTTSGRIAQGPDAAVDYEFSLPALRAADQARFEATIAGDYCISVRQKHQFFNTSEKLKTPRWEERQWPAQPFVSRHNLLGRPQYPIDFKPTEEEPFYTVVRAQGNPDISEPRLVVFDYGIPVGQTLLGADFEIKSQQLVARGELVFNRQQYEFPFNSDSLGVSGQRHGTNALAGYVSLVGKLGSRARDAEVGLEIFRLEADYSGGYDSRRGGMVFFTDRDGDYQSVRGQKHYYGYTQEFELVADNDDADDWSDDWPEEEGRFQPLQPQVYSGVKAHSGVYPGLDVDGDNTPDTDRNRNGVADWTEPFLMFDSDPPEFVYGIDFNNNGVPDRRENDSEADYPYRRDSRGFHLFLAAPDVGFLAHRLTLGYASIQQLAGDGKSRGPYARLSHRSRPFGIIALEFDDDVKYVRDTISDDVYIFDITADGLNSGSVLTPPPPDALEMQKSLVNNAYLRAQARPLRSASIEAKALYFTNKQYEIIRDSLTVQEDDLVTRLTLIGKADYSTGLSDVDLWFGIKGMARTGSRDSLDDRDLSQRMLVPMVRASYPFLTNVLVQVGRAGLPLLPVRFTDGVDEANSYKQTTTILAVTHHTDDYLGYTLTGSMGLQWQKTDYDVLDRSLDTDTFGIFAETFAGF
jgi:hypothetical protein